MGKNYQNIRELLGDLPKQPLPPELENNVLLAVHAEQERSEKISYRLWATSLLCSMTAVLLGVAWSLQELKKEGAIEIAKIAISNLETLKLSEVFWGIVENLPLNSLTLMFCAITILGVLASVKKNHGITHKANILSLQHT